jgi:hypothetical protein
MNKQIYLEKIFANFNITNENLKADIAKFQSDRDCKQIRYSIFYHEDDIYDDPYKFLEKENEKEDEPYPLFQVDVIFTFDFPVAVTFECYCHIPNKYRILTALQDSLYESLFINKYIYKNNGDLTKFNNKFFNLIEKCENFSSLIQLLLIVYKSDYKLDKYKD